jgi:hypothetical protein
MEFSNRKARYQKNPAPGLSEVKDRPGLGRSGDTQQKGE